MIDKFSTKAEVLEAVEREGAALRYASEELRNDWDVVLAAVKESGRALSYSSRELRNDREVVLAAVEQSWYASYYASDELRFEMAECWLERMEQETKND
jgi:hypothetical protein